MDKKSRKLRLSDKIISLIAVTNNDEDIIEKRLKEIKKILSKLRTNYEILIVDNNSSDNTIDKIKKLKNIIPYTRILVLSKKYDNEIALTAGLDNCIGDSAILFNLYTDSVEIVVSLLDKIEEGNDVVVAKCNKDIVSYDFVSKIFLWLTEKISSHGFRHGFNFTMALNRKVINSIVSTRRKSRHFSYINYLVGFKKQIIYYRQIRTYKYKLSKQKISEVVLGTADTIISNSFKPIRIVSFLGLFLSFLFLLYVLGVVILILVFGMKHLAPQGWISTSTVIGTLFFILFSLLTLISEYVIRILIESRDEPFYFVSEEINRSTILPKRKTLNIV
ncbi:MAG: glycosyltransferase [Candidatus Woesebacteria bacterium]|nr:MAG: glycosyltransferase [Candidatus Woesebacteria bacterium]